MAYYRDMREYLDALDRHGLLIRVTKPINKDTQLHPLVRLQFRGLPESQRKAFLFENVYDAKGRTYDIPVAIGILGASRQIYALGLQCKPEEIVDRWVQAQLNPIPPRIVDSGPVHEEVHMGDDLLAHGGFGEFPIPVSTPGWDAGPFLASPYWVTKDPETGVRNVGTYRAHIKSPTRSGMLPSKPTRGIAYHWRKAVKMGKPLEAAIIIGAAPNIGFVSVSNVPVGVDEYSVAGGLAGEPVELVKCKTIDLEVPATAEIVFEGIIHTDSMEPEAPFGEATGFVGEREMAPYFELKCITHRRKPIFQTFLSQFPPSESSVIKEIAWPTNVYKYLRYDLGHEHVRQVAVQCSSGCDRLMVVQVKTMTPPEDVWRSLEAIPDKFPGFSKVIIAVDEDINPWNPELVNWAITYRTLPHRDVRILKGPAPDMMDFSIVPPGSAIRRDHRKEAEEMPEHSRLLINATIKWPYPPVSLPRREYMEDALEIWRELGLPDLDLKEPWYGYSLGHWSEEEEQHARWAVEGEHYRTGEALARQRWYFNDSGSRG